jgi:hypothetical protein
VYLLRSELLREVTVPIRVLKTEWKRKDGRTNGRKDGKKEETIKGKRVKESERDEGG